MALSYASVARVQTQLPAAVGSMSSLTSAAIVTFLEDAEALVNNRIASRYTVPATGTSVPPLLVSIATNIGIYYLLARRIFTQEKMKESAWPDVFKSAIDDLELIAKGDIKLTEADGTLIGARSDVAKAYSTSMTYLPTFHEGGDLDQVEDQDKIDDLNDERGL